MIRAYGRALAIVVFAATAASCAPRAPAPAATPPVSGFPTDFPASFYSTVPREESYRIISTRSSLTLKVYRTGPLASLGHNHIIASRDLDGFVYLADDLGKARADLFVPVAGFIVDDAAARAAAGADFAMQPTPSDIDGTRANMLGPKLLDAQAWPYIVVHAVPLHVEPDSTQVQLSIRTRDHVALVAVDMHWSRKGNELTAEAEFVIDHATLGLEPFSALGGALRVADQIGISVSIVAKAER